jgi:hypothetical protein
MTVTAPSINVSVASVQVTFVKLYCVHCNPTSENRHERAF